MTRVCRGLLPVILRSCSRRGEKHFSNPLDDVACSMQGPGSDVKSWPEDVAWYVEERQSCFLGMLEDDFPFRVCPVGENLSSLMPFFPSRGIDLGVADLPHGSSDTLCSLRCVMVFTFRSLFICYFVIVDFCIEAVDGGADGFVVRWRSGSCLNGSRSARNCISLRLGWRRRK